MPESKEEMIKRVWTAEKQLTKLKEAASIAQKDIVILNNDLYKLQKLLTVLEKNKKATNNSVIKISKYLNKLIYTIGPKVNKNVKDFGSSLSALKNKLKLLNS